MPLPLLPIGTRVHHFGGGAGTHGHGTIVRYNETVGSSYLETCRDASALNMIGQLAESVGSSALCAFYPSSRYPYVVRFDSGYEDVYAPTDIGVL